MRFCIAAVTALLIASSSFADSSTIDDKMLAAVLQEDISQIKDLADAGVDLNVPLPDGRAVLTIAATQSTPDVLEALIQAGADPDALDGDGYSAVMWALSYGQIENALRLEQLGASLDGITNDGFTVRLLAERVGLEDFGPAHPINLDFKMSREEANQILLYAAEVGDLDTIKFAIENGASVNSRANNGWTPLMLAGLGGHASVLETLILNGALETLGIYQDEEGVDLITAILVGEGGNATAFWDNVEGMLHFVLDHKDVENTNILEKRGAQYRAIAEKLEYPLVIINIFPEIYDPLPRIESVIPAGIPGTEENWKRVQSILLNNGLYKGSIDGDAGRGTMGALFSYYQPLAEIVKLRSLKAAGHANRNGATHPLRGPSINAVCRQKVVGSNSKEYSFCGEFKAGRSNGIFTAEFSGYTLSKRSQDRYQFGYMKGNELYSDATKYLSIFESYNLPNETNSPHTIIRADVLDEDFRIAIFDKKIEYYFRSNTKRKGTLQGNFPRPKRPSGY